MKDAIYSYSGKVSSGKKLGRKLGFPTANLLLEEQIPISFGVYIASLYVKENDIAYPSVVNIGVHPSFPDGPSTIEAYILDKDIDLYDDEITIYFHKKIRNEIEFADKKDLIAQIQKDVATAKKFFT